MKKRKGNLLTIRGKNDPPKETAKQSRMDWNHPETIPVVKKDSSDPVLSTAESKTRHDESEKEDQKKCETAVDQSEDSKRVRKRKHTITPRMQRKTKSETP